LLSTTLPIWDFDGIPAAMTDEAVVERTIDQGSRSAQHGCGQVMLWGLGLVS
jgi:hypothetical protein